MSSFLRLNERSQRPNTHVDFIKLTDTNASPSDQQHAISFLQRIAAQCYPVMKENHLYLRTLEDFPPNNEFLGRNFNAGECIQLVLKDRSGRWLSFKFVQMVMMHELAHIKHMNNSKAFWGVRNTFAASMQILWGKSYTGEGMWGKGQDLASGELVGSQGPLEPNVPEHLCGGAYRRKGGRKRKAKQLDDKKDTYAERQQKRIKRKFGKHGDGNAVGENELIRGALEHGKKRSQGKPTVASSKRGRDLRASAALARFEAAKERQKSTEQQNQESIHVDSEADSEYSADSDEDIPTSTSQDNPQKVLSLGGREMIQVCGGEDEDDEGGQAEMEELGILVNIKQASPVVEAGPNKKQGQPDVSKPSIQSQEDKPEPLLPVKPEKEADHTPLQSSTSSPSPNIPLGPEVRCPICSLDNAATSNICEVCSHVLRPKSVQDHWRCKNRDCAQPKYINSGDVQNCGLCGTKRPLRALGVIGTDVLRWD